MADLEAPTNPSLVPDSSNDQAVEVQPSDVEADSPPHQDTGVDGADGQVSTEVIPKVSSKVDHWQDVRRSMFQNEEKAAISWIGFTATYWTLVVWIPTLVLFDFATPGFFGWCVASLAMISGFYTWKGGAWPSGATRANPNETAGIGRYTAFALTACVCIDFLVLSYYAIKDGVNDGKDYASVFRGSCHVLSLLWASLFFFNRFYAVNPDIAITAFFGEWLDISATVVVMFVLHNALFSDEDASDVQCFDEGICVVYYISFIFQLMGWLFPMMLLEGWGTGKDGMGVSRHLFIVDILTDIPIIFAILITDAYKDHAIIFIDLLWKTVLTIRSIGYYLIYEIWLQKGDRVFTRNLLDRKRGETLK